MVVAYREELLRAAGGKYYLTMCADREMEQKEAELAGIVKVLADLEGQSALDLVGLSLRNHGAFSLPM